MPSNPIKRSSHSQLRPRRPGRSIGRSRKLPVFVALVAATIASGIAYAAFNVDPALLAEARGRAASLRTGLAAAVSSPIGDRLAAAKGELDAALLEWDAAWAAVRTATARVDAARRELRSARESGAAGTGVPAQEGGQFTTRPGEPSVAGVYERGTTAFRQHAFSLPRGEYSRVKFFAMVLPLGYTNQVVRESNLDRVVVADDSARTWVEWLDLAGKQTSSVLIVSYRYARVTHTTALEPWPKESKT